MGPNTRKQEKISIKLLYTIKSTETYLSSCLEKVVTKPTKRNVGLTALISF